MCYIVWKAHFFKKMKWYISNRVEGDVWWVEVETYNWRDSKPCIWRKETKRWMNVVASYVCLWWWGRSHITICVLFLQVLSKWVWVARSCLTLCDDMDCSLPGSSVHGIFQTRIFEWVAMPSSRGSSKTSGSNPGLLHCKHILFSLSHQRSKSVTEV